jgi:hypothetical protein
MPSNYDARKQVFADLEVTPSAKIAIPAGADGQIVPVTDWAYGNRLGIRKGTVVGPAAAFCTTERIVMSVDPLLGVSPGVNTIVTSQAEYDALGAPLLYVQDAVDILPEGIGGPVIVYLEDGEHLAKPGNPTPYGTDSAFIRTLKHFYSVTGKWLEGASFTYPFPMYSSSINFIGRNTVELVADQAGTYDATGTFLVRDVGTGWTVDEFQGKFICEDYGDYGIYYTPIVGNTTNTLEVPFGYAYPGGTTFSIVSHSAIALSSTDGITNNAKGIWLDGPSSCRFNFCRLQLGKFGLGMVQAQIDGLAAVVQIQECLFYTPTQHAVVYPSTGFGTSPTLLLYNCTFLQDSVAGISGVLYTEGGSFCIFFGCFMRAQIDSGSNSFCDFRAGSTGEFGSCTIHDLSNNNAKGGISLNETRCRVDNVKYVSKFSGKGCMFFVGAHDGPLAELYLRGTIRCEDGYAVISAAGGVELKTCGVGIIGSGNANGVILAGGGTINLKTPANIGGTVNVTIDGLVYTWASQFAAAGDSVLGRYGSKIMRTA